MKWVEDWQMEFDAPKCQVINITSQKKAKLLHRYSMNQHTLEVVDHTTYLGVEISHNLSWDR